MSIAIAIGIVVVIAAIALLASNFGKDPARKTDAQLWREYLLHDRRFATASGKTMMDVLAQAQPVKDELARRGYDISKLITEDGNAKFQGRPMDFSKCKREPT